MAIGTTTTSDLIVYNQLAQTSYLERIQDNLNVFNQSSAGAIRFLSQAITGDFSQSAFYKIGGTVTHRDVTSTSAAALNKLGADEMVGVKTPWKYGPYASTEEAFKRRARSLDEFAVLVGQDNADAIMAYWIECAMASMKAAIGSNSDMVVSANLATDGKKAFTKGFRTMGDKFQTTAIWVMDAATYLDVIDQAITDKIYEEAGVVIYGGTAGTFGKPVLVTDKSPVDTIFGLQPGAITVTESQAPGVRFYNIDTQENLALGYRSEGAFNLEVLGYSYDISAGENPNLATLGSTANWNKYATSNKATAGFYIDLSSVSASGSGA